MDLFEYIGQNCNDEFKCYQISVNEEEGCVLLGLPNRKDSVEIQCKFFSEGEYDPYGEYYDPYTKCAGSNIKGVLSLEADQIITIEDTKTMFFQNPEDPFTMEGMIIGKVIQKVEFGYVVSVEDFPYPICIEDETTDFAVNDLVKARGELIFYPYRP